MVATTVYEETMPWPRPHRPSDAANNIGVAAALEESLGRKIREADVAKHVSPSRALDALREAEVLLLEVSGHVEQALALLEAEARG